MDFVHDILDPLSRHLDDPAFDPDPTRPDWSARRPALEELRAIAEQAVVAVREMGRAPATGSEAAAVLPAAQLAPLTGIVASLVGEVAAVHHAAGEGAALSLLDRADSIAPEGTLRDELRAARVDVSTYTRLVRARWLQRHGQFAEADAILRAMSKSVREPGLLAGVRAALEAPRPISGAPPLFRLNGFGAGLYGERDHGNDGSYVSTYCISALWIPIFPISAYRVRRPSHNQFQFFAKVPLSGFARASRWAALAALALVIGGGAISSWLDSPERRAAIALEDARRTERAGHPDEAATAYRQAAVEFAFAVPSSTLEPAVSSFVRLASKRVPQPVTLASVEPASVLVREYEGIPESLRRGAAAHTLSGALERWATESGDADPARATASLRFLELARRVAPSEERSRIESRSAAVRRGMALRIAADFPVEALGQVLAAGDDPETRAAAGTILRDLARSPSLLLAAANDARAWLTAAASDEPSAAAAAEVRTALDAATAAAADPARLQALESGEERALAAQSKRAPADQEVAVALADALRSRGEAEGARALLEALGPVGRQVPAARRALASSLVELGHLEDADALLDRALAVELAPFQEARTALSAATTTLRDRLIASAEQGLLPPDVQRRLVLAQGDEAAQVFIEWAGPQLASDPELTRLRAIYERHVEVVPTALLGGTIKLRRAADASGEAREQILADAERLFLAIQEEASDDPGYQLGLGQVYHRLGRTDDGERAMKSVLDRGDPELTLAVARTYRELGLAARAREVATQLHDTAEGAVRSNAAVFLSLLAQRAEEQERWLREADQSDPFVQVSLLQAEGSRFYRDGDLAQAEQRFADAARRFGRDAAHDAAAANNAALAWQSRYLCTGDLADLRRSVDGLEAARRSVPDNALILGNLGRTLAYLGTVEVLDRHVKTKALKLDPRSADDLVTSMENGPAHEEIVTAIRTNARHRRALDVLRQQEALSPRDGGTWREELDAHERADDTAALRSLSERLTSVSDLDTTDDDSRASWESGREDERFLSDIDAVIGRGERTLTAADASRHPPTIAAAQYLQGILYGARVPLSNAATDAEKACDLLRRADEGWPALGASHALAWSMVGLAELRAAARSEPLAYLLREEQRHFDADVLLHRAMTGHDGAAILQALRADPDLAAAAVLRRTHPGAVPSVSDWVLARVAGDTALEHAALPALAREDVAVTRRIEATLRPGAPGPRAAVELLTAATH